jgi:hypothetical protein
VRAQLTDNVKPVDVAQAEILLEKHYELRTEIGRKNDEFAYVNELGARLLKKSTNATDVKVFHK